MTIALALLLTATPVETSGPVCGADMPSTTILVEHLRASSALRHLREAEGITTYFDDHRATLWWVTSRKHAAFPAIICRRLGGPIHLRCGRDLNACKALGLKMTKAKF